MRACKCPNCGANLNYDEEQFKKGFCFCQYCGSKILLDDYRSTHTHIHRVIDEARIKEVELQNKIKLKELENAEQKRREAKKAKKSKRIGVIVRILILIAGIFLLINSNFLKLGEEIDWVNIRLGYLLPEPKSKWMDVHSNSETDLYIYVYEMTLNDFLEYVRMCEKIGFTIEPEITNTTFKAYNQDGYYLKLLFTKYGGDGRLNIDLSEPPELTEYRLPDYATTAHLPTPKSNLGYYQWENSTAFYLHVGNTTKEEYEAYKIACMEAGFNVDSREYSEHYYANNQEGFELEISYSGFYTLNIILRCPEDS